MNIILHSLGGFGQISKIKRLSDGKILVWKEIDYSKLEKKEREQLIEEVNILNDTTIEIKILEFGLKIWSIQTKSWIHDKING